MTVSNWSIRMGDVLARLREMEAESVQCVVTSPPYWGLRDYGVTPSVWGGDVDHAHKFLNETIRTELGKGNWAQGTNGRGEAQPGGVTEKRKVIAACATRGMCACGAWLGVLGMEPTPETYVEHLVAVFREVRRVLRRDGTCWINLGDSYANNGCGGQGATGGLDKSTLAGSMPPVGTTPTTKRLPIGMKPKNLIGMPWRVALALQADGWYLRTDIIWSKPNPMPESVTDRPTRSHEYIFLLTRRERYFYNHVAIKEPCVYHDGRSKTRIERATDTSKRFPSDKVNGIRPRSDKQRGHSKRHAGFNERWNLMTTEEQCSGYRNKRSVWTIATEPFSEAHFATYPKKLIEPCILAGSRPGDVVLDPFCGSGTTLIVAVQHGRVGLGIELNPEYVAMAQRRIVNELGVLAVGA